VLKFEVVPISGENT